MTQENVCILSGVAVLSTTTLFHRTPDLDTSMKRILALLAVLVVWSTSAFGQDIVERITTLVDTYGDKTPPLHLAVFRGETETVKTLIENGEDVNYFWVQHRYTPLEFATILGDLDIMRLLLDNGANPDRLVDGYLDMPALRYADDVEIAQLLLDRGAYAKSWVGETPLLTVLAQKGINIDVVKLLIANGADVNAYGEGGAPLHEAKNAGIAQILIDNGADVNARRELGDTPLLSAVWNGKKDIVKILIDHGADINAKNNAGHTPLDIAIERGQDEIVNLLREHGGVTTNVTTE